MSPEFWEFIKSILPIIGSVLASGGIGYLWMEGRNRNNEIKLKADFDLQMKDKENQHELKVKDLEQESERNKTELARLRADSDRDMIQSEDRRQWISLIKDREQNNIKLTNSIDKLADTIQRGDEKAADWTNKLNNHMSTTNVLLSRLPEDVAKAMHKAMREAIRDDIGKAHDDLAFQLGTKLDELIQLVKESKKTDQEWIHKFDSLKDVVDRALPVLQEISDNCKEDKEQDKEPELKVVPKEAENQEHKKDSA